MRDETKKLVRKADKLLFEGRVKRHEFLEALGIEFEGLMMNGVISREYHFEATRCWLEGLFVATIVMMQMTFEEGLRHVYRGYYSLRDDHKGLKEINEMSFYHLIEFAKKKRYITRRESIQLHNLRKMRNPYVHVARNEKDQWISSGKSEFAIMLKISEIYKVQEGMLDESILEKEAKNVMRFSKLYYKIFSRILL
ncbi:MAG: hypothetical protein KGH88_08645 [Thaumarchaeota archaeon]|nr:hypothetical protein [Nitrososphaerota archaeon]